MKVTFQYANGRNRAMSLRDARILQKLGHGVYMTRDMRAQPGPAVVAPVAPTEDDDLTALRARYQEVIGRRPYHGWSAEEIEQKIAEAQSPDGGNQ